MTTFKSRFPRTGSKATIILTGATGFLGSNILRRLVAEHYHVIITTRSTSDTWRINDVLDRVDAVDISTTNLDKVFSHPVDGIIHCATDYGRRHRDMVELLDANLIFPLKLLQAAKENNISFFINTDTILDKRVSDYSLSKGQFKEWLRRFSDDVACINVALEHFYGPFDDSTKFVTYIIRSLAKKVDSIDLTAGAQKRDFIYIDDVVNAFFKIIERSRSLTNGLYMYEIGTGRTISIREFVLLAKTVTNNTNTRLNFGAIPYRENEVMETRVDISEILKLHWLPQTSLEQGLARTVEAEREQER